MTLGLRDGRMMFFESLNRKELCVLQLQEVKDAIISQIENLSNNQIESVWTYLQELTEAKNHQVDLLNQYLTFWCDKQLLGIRITKIVEVISMIEITPLPDFPPYMTGIISLRDNMIPVMDLRLRLGNTETPYNNHTCIVIVDIQGRSFGLIVDAVNDVERIPEHEICPPPTQTNCDASYLEGIAKREHIILILSIDYLLSENEINSILKLPDGV